MSLIEAHQGSPVCLPPLTTGCVLLHSAHYPTYYLCTPTVCVLQHCVLHLCPTPGCTLLHYYCVRSTALCPTSVFYSRVRFTALYTTFVTYSRVSITTLRPTPAHEDLCACVSHLIVYHPFTISTQLGSRAWTAAQKQGDDECSSRVA